MLGKRSPLSLAFLLSLTCTSQAQAETSYSLQTFAGYKFSSSFDQEDSEGNKTADLDIDDKSSLGLIMSWPFDNKRHGQLLFSHQNTAFDSSTPLQASNEDLTIQYLHLGGSIPIDDGVVPFWFSGGLGVAHFSPDANQFDDETKLSANLGVNTQFQMTETIGLVFGARVYATFFNSDSEIFCDSDQCLINISSDVWLQSELSIGLNMSF